MLPVKKILRVGGAHYEGLEVLKEARKAELRGRDALLSADTHLASGRKPHLSQA